MMRSGTVVKNKSWTFAWSIGDQPKWKWGIEPMGTIESFQGQYGYDWCWTYHLGYVTLCVTRWNFSRQSEPLACNHSDGRICSVCAWKNAAKL